MLQPDSSTVIGWVKEIVASKGKLKSGVPQGSVLDTTSFWLLFSFLLSFCILEQMYLLLLQVKEYKSKCN